MGAMYMFSAPLVGHVRSNNILLPLSELYEVVLRQSAAEDCILLRRQCIDGNFHELCRTNGISLLATFSRWILHCRCH